MPTAIAAVAAYVTAAVVSATATTSLIAAQIIYATAYAATAVAASAALNYGLDSVFGGSPSSQEQGQLVSLTAPVSPNRHVIGRARVVGIAAWQGSFAWKSGDDTNHGFGQMQTISATPITEIEKVLASDITLTGVPESYTGVGAPRALAADQLPYNKGQGAGLSRLYYHADIGSDPGVRDPLLGWFADQAWQPLVTSPYAGDADMVPFYGTNSRGDGLAKLSSAAYEDIDSFPQGPPRMSAVVKGVKVYDPRDVGQDPDDPTTWEFSKNSALVAAWYITRPFSFAASYDEINIAALTVAANACDEEVETFASTGAAGDPPMEPRYFCGGEVIEDDNRDSTLAAIVATMAGSWCLTGGVWYFYAGVYSEPTEEIDDTWIMRNVTFTAQKSRLQAFNTVNGTFMSEARLWQAAPFPQVQDADALADDNGVEIIQPVDLPFVQSHTLAQRISIIQTRRLHKPRALRAEYPLGYALRLIIGQTVAITRSILGLAALPFVVTSWEIVGMDDDGTIWVAINCDEDGADIYETTIDDLQDADGSSDPSPPPESEGDVTPDPPGGEAEGVIL